MITEQCTCPPPHRRIKTAEQWLCAKCGKAYNVAQGEDACDHIDTFTMGSDERGAYRGPTNPKLVEVWCKGCGQMLRIITVKEG